MTIRDHVFLELAVGVRSAIARLDQVLERHAPEHAQGEPSELDDGVAVVLGVIAIRNRLLAELDALPADPGRGERGPALDADLPAGSWLR